MYIYNCIGSLKSECPKSSEIGGYQWQNRWFWGYHHFKNPPYLDMDFPFTDRDIPQYIGEHKSHIIIINQQGAMNNVHFKTYCKTITHDLVSNLSD